MTWQIINSDSRFIPMKDNSVQTVVTSPPYWGLRDYGIAGQLGLERTPEEYVSRMVEVFAEVWRVLRDDGTVWINLGDSYARNGGEPGGGNRELLHMEGKQRRMNKIPDCGLKSKDLVGVPWRIAFALQAAGWYLRSDIIWSKPNPMPESVTDRPTKAHEYIFLLAKRERYYFDADAVSEPLAEITLLDRRFGATGTGRPRYDTNGDAACPSGFTGANPNGHNIRTVWNIATQPYAEAHFATFPEELAERCIKAGSKPRDVVLDPFGGAGTTALVADKLNRRGIGLELKPEYCQLARRRCYDDAPLLA